MSSEAELYSRLSELQMQAEAAPELLEPPVTEDGLALVKEINDISIVLIPTLDFGDLAYLGLKLALAADMERAFESGSEELAAEFDRALAAIMDEMRRRHDGTEEQPV